MNKKIGPLLFLLILIVGIPVTVFLSLQPQDIRQRSESLPDPLSSECSDIEHNPQRSVLNNWDLAGNYDSNGAPAGWSLIKSGNVTVSKETGYEKFGEASMLITGQGAFSVVLYQTVDSLQANQWYHAFYNVANEVWGPGGAKNSGTPALKRVGIDPNGGIDSNASSVLWGQRSAGGPDEKAAILAGRQDWGKWRFLGTRDNPLLTFKTTGNKVTFFIAINGYDDISRTTIWVDTTFLVTCNQAGPGVNPPQTPTNTPAPTAPGPNATCDVNGSNLLQNCDFEASVNDFSANSSNWRDVQLDPERNAGSGQYTNDNKIVSLDQGNALEIGRATGTCTLAKTAGGGNNDLFRIFTETRQNTTVGTGSNFHLSFDFKIKSRHTRHNSAPFYTIAGFTSNQSLGKEIGLAYTPHDEAGEVCEPTPFPNDYSCRLGWSVSTTDCSDAFTSWKHVSIDFTRSQLCENNGVIDQSCMQNGKKLFVGFGITNDYDTVVNIDNVVLTGDGVTPQPTATPGVGQPTATTVPGQPTATPPPGCSYQQVQCVRAPCPAEYNLVCLSPTPGPVNFLLTISLSGIGNSGNANPRTKDRTATIDFYNYKNEKQTSQNVTVTYERRSGLFKGELELNNLSAGPYTIRVKVPGYLRKELPGIIAIPLQNIIELPTTMLRTGDINNDNVLDLQDLQTLTSCLSQGSTFDSTCAKIDLNDDGVVDIDDYNLFRDTINKRI